MILTLHIKGLFINCQYISSGNTELKNVAYFVQDVRDQSHFDDSRLCYCMVTFLQDEVTELSMKGEIVLQK